VEVGKFCTWPNHGIKHCVSCDCLSVWLLWFARARSIATWFYRTNTEPSFVAISIWFFIGSPIHPPSRCSQTFPWHCLLDLITRWWSSPWPAAPVRALAGWDCGPDLRQFLAGAAAPPPRRTASSTGPVFIPTLGNTPLSSSCWLPLSWKLVCDWNGASDHRMGLGRPGPPPREGTTLPLLVSWVGDVHMSVHSMMIGWKLEVLSVVNQSRGSWILRLRASAGSSRMWLNRYRWY
jgi:hypothetical protein